jgi:soluble lytic murein transglycosylase-like protein
MIRSFVIAVTLFVGLCISTVHASCQAFVPQLEKKYNIPPGLLKAILTVESRSTPWAVNTSNSSRFFKNKDSALQHVQRLKKSGIRNINVGCAQLNIPSHAHRFKTIGHLIDPAENVAYAARLLRTLYNRYGTWEMAVRRYNSGSNGRPYKAKVFRVWKQQQSKAATAHLVTVKQVIPASPFKD